MWEQLKQVMVESARELCGSVRVEGKNPKSVWWNTEVKAAARIKSVLIVIKMQKKDVWELTKKKRENLKDVYIRSKRK